MADDVHMTSANETYSQKYLLWYLFFLQDMVEMRSREMQNTMCVQIIEPLVQLIAVKPCAGNYLVDLAVQEAALLILKTITKRSHIFDDSNLLLQIIDRLKAEIFILKEDLLIESAENQRLRTVGSNVEFNSITLEKRQKFIKDCLGFLCYSIIRMDPT